MMRNSRYLAMALGAAVLLAGCSAKSPTAPKPQPTPSAFNISLTPESSTAQLNEPVVVVAQVTSGSGNAPDGTSVTFVASAGGFSPVQLDNTGKIVGPTTTAVTTSGGHAAVTVTSDVAATVTITAGVPGGTSKTAVTFYEAAPPTPTPTPTPPPDYTPVIYTLTPNQGPMEGGTRVTITGKGFQTPVQVNFGKVQAQVVSSDYNQIVCISPSIAALSLPPPQIAQVSVVNKLNGLQSNALEFVYGLNMFISSFSPMEGPADTPTTVTIFGQGFVAPVTVVATAGGLYQWDVLSVAGTEIVARSKPLPESARTCGDVPATLTVTNVNSNTTATATNPFTYRAIRPLITSVQLAGGGNTVLQYVPVAVPPSVAVCSTPWSSYPVTIKGSGFQQGMTVNFGPAGPVVATFVDANTLTLAQLPDLTSVGLNQIQCTTGAGACGSRFVPTQVSVTVNNPHNGCVDTLNGAIVINPCDTSCLATLVATLSFVTQPPASATVGTSFNIQLGFTPSPLAMSATVDLTYVGFDAGPSSVPISGNSPNPPFSVTPTSAGSGFIIASVGSGSCAVRVTSTSITVNPLTFQLTVTKSGNVAGGDITSLPSGLASCLAGTTPCTGTFNDGTPVTLTASTVANWSGSCTPSGTNPTASATVTMDAAKSCNAAFP